MTSSKKVPSNDCTNDRQPEIANIVAQTGNTPMIHSCTSRLKTTRLPALTGCIHAVRHWLDLNGLSFKSRQNGSIHHRHWLTTTIEGPVTAVDTGAVTVQTSHSVKSLGVTIDDIRCLSLANTSTVDNVCKATHFHLRALRHIRR